MWQNLCGYEQGNGCACLPISRIGSVTAEKKLFVKDAISIGVDVLVKPFKETLQGI
jgi:hypothetical protein